MFILSEVKRRRVPTECNKTWPISVSLILLLVAEISAQNAKCDPKKCILLANCGIFQPLIKTRPIPPNIASFLRQTHCGFEGKDPKVCCVKTITNPLLPTRAECGQNVEDKIVGGLATDITDFPWTALLEYTKPNGKGFHCGGSLISARYVITAAHCIQGASITPGITLTSVRLGEWDIDSENDCNEGICSNPPVNVPVESATVHEGYDSSNPSQPNDIALVRLSQPVTMTDYISPVCLPLISLNAALRPQVGQNLTVAGWGQTETASDSKVKLKVVVPGVDFARCSETYSTFGVTLARTQLCAGGQKGRDSCRGDSGGPLMSLHEEGDNQNWFLDGVSSFGPTPCGSANWPGIYTRIASYSAWINENVKP